MNEFPTLTIVFTGPATDKNGASVLRSAVVQAALTRQCKVMEQIGPSTDYLVASTFSTVKARKAISRGIKTISYIDFFELLTIRRPIDPEEFRVVMEDVNPFVDDLPVSADRPWPEYLDVT